MKIFINLILLLIISVQSFSQIIINEIQPSNSGIIADNMGDYDDWIELYNAGDETVDIGGLVLKDAVDVWAIPLDDTSTILEPGEYFILWADDEEPEGKFHTNFKLSASKGEFLGLYESDSITVIDSITFPPVSNGYSYGQCGENHMEWIIMLEATPNAQNTCLTVIKNLLKEDIIVYSTGINGEIRIDFPNNSNIHVDVVKLFDITGKAVPFERFISDKCLILKMHNYSNGLYFIKLNFGKNQISKKIILK